MTSHNSPHPSAIFEGWYSKFRLPSGSSIALIISSVPHARPPAKKKYMISFNYVSPDGSTWWQRETWPEKWEVTNGAGGDFTIQWEDGRFGATGQTMFWRLESADIQFIATLPTRGVPWKPDDQASTPAGLLTRLPLPIQWHVHTVDAPAEFTLNLKDTKLYPGDEQGTAQVHAEKNWAVSFPKSNIWIQARDHDRHRGVSLAGGSLFPGVQAYLVGYHGNSFHDFSPPSSTSLFGLSLGLKSHVDSTKGEAEVDIKGWFSRIRIFARADTETFFTLAAPLDTGHAEGWTAQSFAAVIDVEVYQRSWPWTGWVKVDGDRFERGSLEYGGSLYKAHGK
ncbi:hypothetical protein BCR39DRAFT_274050 [Naematelia encephala]|uniref:Uncharacterized protein n=1 Tax=Naematelia encephala TaxID=71784 RepID=A0A1Y2AVX1_9TREE|nr:hypothetical protein BCR39DRAFT_274050 [Naematelia encephala]